MAGETGIGAFARRRWRLLALLGAALVLVLAVAAVAVVSWLFSSQLLDVDHSRGPFGIEVDRFEVRDGADGVSDKVASFERDEATERPGIYGINLEHGGHAIAGEVLEVGDDEVSRRVSQVQGELGEGDSVAFSERVWEGDPLSSRGIPFREVSFPSQLGRMPAWRVSGRGDTWAIFVHGMNVTRVEGLRVLGTLHRMRIPTLLTAYRNDPEAPASEDGLLHLGATEWLDVDAAARYAIRHGARRLIMLGDSMGGAIVSAFVHRSALSGRISALILDAPVLDWRAVISYQAEQRGLPGFLATTTEWTVTGRIDFDWDDFDQIARADEFTMPILLFHGTEDDLVPASSTEAFARALPGRVTYFSVPEAGHVESWNVDPRLYDRRVKAFLNAVLPATPSGP